MRTRKQTAAQKKWRDAQKSANLPPRVRYVSGAYYFSVPKGKEADFDGKQTYRIGTTREEAVNFYIERGRKPGDFNPFVAESITKTLEMKSRRGAKTRGKEHDLDAEYIRSLVDVSEGRCQLSGVPFETIRQGGYHPFCPSLDRIDNTRGYVKGNVRVVCVAMNVALADWGEEVFEKIARGFLYNKSLETSENRKSRA